MKRICKNENCNNFVDKGFFCNECKAERIKQSNKKARQKYKNYIPVEKNIVIRKGILQHKKRGSGEILTAYDKEFAEMPIWDLEYLLEKHNRNKKEYVDKIVDKHNPKNKNERDNFWFKSEKLYTTINGMIRDWINYKKNHKEIIREAKPLGNGVFIEDNKIISVDYDKKEETIIERDNEGGITNTINGNTEYEMDNEGKWIEVETPKKKLGKYRKSNKENYKGWIY